MLKAYTQAVGNASRGLAAIATAPLIAAMRAVRLPDDHAALCISSGDDLADGLRVFSGPQPCFSARHTSCSRAACWHRRRRDASRRAHALVLRILAACSACCSASSADCDVDSVSMTRGRETGNTPASGRRRFGCRSLPTRQLCHAVACNMSARFLTLLDRPGSPEAIAPARPNRVRPRARRHHRRSFSEPDCLWTDDRCMSFRWLLATGMPIAFALGLAAFAALYMQSGAGIFYVLGDTMFSGIANLPIVSIPMFVSWARRYASSRRI